MRSHTPVDEFLGLILLAAYFWHTCASILPLIDQALDHRHQRGCVACQNSLRQLTLATVGAAKAQDVSADELRPGLVASYRDEAKPTAIEVVRLEPTIALALQGGEAPHPRLAADGGVAHWEGYLNVVHAGNYRFRVLLRGRFRLSVGGKEILSDEEKNATPAVHESAETRLEAGVLPLSADFTRLPGVARLELCWQSSQFQMEPMPYDVLGHLPAQEPARLETDSLAEHGRFLAEERNCTSCHRPEDSDRIARTLHKRQGPDLSQVGQRVHPGWIYRWLDVPSKIRPGAVMPSLFPDGEGGSVERYAVAHYLASLGGPVPASAKPLPKKDLDGSRARGQALFTSLGCVACHRPDDGKQSKEAAVGSFYGLGTPTGVRATYPLSGLGSKTTPEKLAAYLANPLAVDPSGRMPHMLLQGKEVEDIARYLCQATEVDGNPDLPAAPVEEQVLAALKRIETRADEVVVFQRLRPDQQVLDLGKRLMIARRCSSCHTIAPGGKPLAETPAAASLADIKKPDKQDAGCLAREAAQRGKAPSFAFTDRERKGLQGFLREGCSGAGSPAPAYAARVALRRFNCLACHSRDGEGGLTPDLVEELRHYEKAENAEAVSPPPLTGVGHKLRTPWLRQVLTQAGRARPWMALRMPQIGDDQVGRLPEGFAALEGVEPDDQLHKVALTAANLEAGRRLVGRDSFGCISCHDIAGIPNTGTRGPDLALMNQRVRYDWYRRWLELPQRMQPGTRMPTVFSEGKSLVDKVLSGSADAQAEAMWAYLSLGPGLPLPAGLEPPKGLVLTVKDRPILLRTFMPDAGSRAVAVGYLGGVSTAFDASTCRLAYAWSGNFLDASPVWDGRGGNPARPLGPRFWTAPAGCPWAATASQEPPDFSGRTRDPAYGAPLPEGKLYDGPRQVRFDGYRTDTTGLPSFHYRVEATDPHTLAVTEQPEPLRSPVAAGLTRHFSIDAPGQETPWLFAGEAAREPRLLDSKGSPVALDLKATATEAPAAGMLLVLPQAGERPVVLAAAPAPAGCRWHLRRTGNTWQALLRLPMAATEEKVQLDLKVWVPYRDEPGLLKELLPAK
jgi:mono/diheme cytochrome c family protein